MPTLVLLRHAHRGLADDQISPKGQSQAEYLSQQIPKVLPVPDRLICSPKMRTKQTLEILGKRFSLLPVVDDLLDERQRSEDGIMFSQRVRSGTEKYLDEPESCTYLCSHMDWLHESLFQMNCELSETELEEPWQAGEARVFSMNSDGILTLLRKTIPPQ